MQIIMSTGVKQFKNRIRSLTDEFYQNKNDAGSKFVNIYQMNIQQQFPTLLFNLNNLPLHNLLSILSYLDQETKIKIQQNSTKKQNCNCIFQNLISMSLFASKYLTSTDRTVYFNFYSEPAFMQYEKELIGDICVRNPNKYFKIQRSLQKIFNLIKQELQLLDNKQSLIQIIETNIKDPLIPLPRMRKQGIAMHCNSSLQFGLVDLIFEAGQEQDNFIQDCVLDLEQFLECIQTTMYKILNQKIKIKTRGKSITTLIKQIYYHPQLLNLYNYQDYIIKSLTTFNLYVYMHAIISGVAQMYHQYITDQQKQFQRFIQYLMRYSIFRSIILSLEQSKISKILYTAVQKLIQKVDEISGERQSTTKIEQQIIYQANIQLQNKRSAQEMQIQQLNLIHNISKISSEVKTIKSQKSNQLYKNSNIQMSCRLFLASGKIWANQNRRVKQLNEQNNSPSKFNTSASQDTINNKSYMKILNRLLHYSIQNKLQKQIMESYCQSGFKQVHVPVPDENIYNIFGANVDTNLEHIPINSYGSIPLSVGSHSPSSPTYAQMNFSQLIKNLDNNCVYQNFMRAVQNKFKVQQYRFQKGKQIIDNDTSSISPEKQQTQMPQIHLQKLNKIPSLKQHKILSKVSLMSKFTKISDIKSISSVQDLFESDICIQQQILMEYHSHLIDLSVNQNNVHWCGHSQQPLMFDYYQNFQDLLLKFNQGFMYYTFKTVEQVANKIINQQRGFQLQHQSHNNFENVSLKLLKKLLQWQIQYLDIGFICKKSIKKLCNLANDLLLRSCKKYKVNLQEKDFLNFNNDDIDKMIEHYNKIMWKIEKNPPTQKLKIYQQRKSPRNIIQVARQQHHNQNNKEKNLAGKKPERKRRNSEQVLVMYNVE